MMTSKSTQNYLLPTLLIYIHTLYNDILPINRIRILLNDELNNAHPTYHGNTFKPVIVEYSYKYKRNDNFSIALRKELYSPWRTNPYGESRNQITEHHLSSMTLKQARKDCIFKFINFVQPVPLL